MNQPFVVFETYLVDGRARGFKGPLGVVLAENIEDASTQVKIRWSDEVLFAISRWEKTPPDLRLAAIEEDRMSIFR